VDPFDSFVLAASTGDPADLAAVPAVADAVELRLDLAARDAALSALADHDGPPVIATNRVETEGGAAPEGPDRLALLDRVADLPAVAAVDVELATVAAGRGRDLLDRGDVATVVSVHDFEGTPDRERMRALLVRACEAGTVGKLAVTATDRDDALSLLAVTNDLASEGRRVATVAMGEPGRHTRAVAPVYGSRIGYAPLDPASATAPGQYDLATLADLLDRLR
jgi:3-dehydroquinate dehydratase-1